MSLFSNILEKLGLKKPAAPAPKHGPTATATATVKPTPIARPWEPTASSPTPKVTPPTSAPAAPKVYTDSRPVPEAFKAAAVPEVAPVEMVDVVSKLEKLAKDNGGKLKWKASIVDLLKLLGIDSSLEARKELAVELGCPPEKMKDSVNMNIWLHKTVLQKIAENGGNIPKELLD
jgi:hypothetical protein